MWLPVQNGTHKLIVLAETSAAIVAASASSTILESSNEYSSYGPNSKTSSKRQYIFIFEGVDTLPAINAGASSTPPINLELRQTIVVKSPYSMGFRLENFAACGKGFIVVGTYGHVAIYDRTDEKRDPYVEVKKFTIGQLHLMNVAVYPSEDKFNVVSESGR
jgi:hypothetical protein